MQLVIGNKNCSSWSLRPWGLIDGALHVWDSLAIAEYLAERFPEHRLWPQDRQARARARSACAEMHAGFGALRAHCTMNIEARLPEVGARLLREQPGVSADLERIVALWSELLREHGGPLLFGRFTVALKRRRHPLAGLGMVGFMAGRRRAP